MATSRCTYWLRCVLLAGLCYALAVQGLLVQVAGIATAAETSAALCHSGGDQDSGGGDHNPLSGCHFCWLPLSSTTLLPGSNAGVVPPRVAASTAYSPSFDAPVFTRPPPRGASRAPPLFA